MQTFIVIYSLDDCVKWNVVHAFNSKGAEDFIKTTIPGAEVTNIRGPVQEFTSYYNLD